jgi:DNA-binding HxlR family transcriptional regulator
MTSHREYCPISAAVDVLGDRWTPLVMRELMVGASGFNDIHRGIPRASRSLLAQRLRTLERHGLVVKESAGRGRPGRYVLTPAGESLTPVIWDMGRWAAAWMFGDPTDEECDGLGLIWRLHQHADVSRLPASRTVVHVVLTGPGAAQGWLDIRDSAVTVCKDDPGLDVDLAVESSTRSMARWLVGRVEARELVRQGDLRFLGPSRLARAFPTWFDTSFFEPLQRPASGRRAS